MGYITRPRWDSIGPRWDKIGPRWDNTGPRWNNRIRAKMG